MNELFSWFSTLFHVLKNSAPKSRLAQLLEKWTKAFDLPETLSLKFVLRLLWARLILRTILAQVAPYVSKNGPVCLKNVTLQYFESIALEQDCEVQLKKLQML